MPRFTSSLLSLMAVLLGARMAQAQQEVIWGSIIISTFGDRVPIYSPNYSVITPLGAQQMYESGSYYRQRYISNPATRGASSIPNISIDILKQDQAIPYTTSDVWLQQSAQSFMNGLYPPLGSKSQNLASAQSANGSSVTGPLNGLQYPLLQAASQADPNYAVFAGKENCPAWEEEKRRNITSQPWYQGVMRNSQPRFDGLNSTAFADALPGSNVGYSNSYEVWEWLNYMKTHNSSLAGNITGDDVAWSRFMAGTYWGQIFRSTDNIELTMPGRMLSWRVMNLLAANAYQLGSGTKINMLFTPWESLLSLMYLLGLPQKYTDLDTIPNPASSLVIELYSNVDTYQNPSKPVINPTYPADPLNNLSVRVLYRNATGANSTLATYTIPAVSTGDSQQAVTLSQFIAKMKSWSMSVTAWCALCSSTQTPVFCTGLTSYNNGDYIISVTDGSSSSSRMTGPTPAVAGVIGAIVTLIASGLAALALMLLGGFRLRRDRPSVVTSKSGLIVHKRRQSSMGGFKGAEKMASDVDLPKSGLVGASVLPAHNRTASWEMREGSSLRREERDSQGTAVGEPGPEISDVAGIRVVKDEDEELGGLKPVKVRESF